MNLWSVNPAEKKSRIWHSVLNSIKMFVIIILKTPLSSLAMNIRSPIECWRSWFHMEHRSNYRDEMNKKILQLFVWEYKARVEYVQQ